MFINYDFLLNKCSSLNNFFDVLIHLPSYQNTNKSSTPMFLFCHAFKNEFQSKVEKMEEHHYVLANYGQFAHELNTLVKLIEEEQILKIKRHKLFFLYTFFNESNDYFKEKRTHINSGKNNRLTGTQEKMVEKRTLKKYIHRIDKIDENIFKNNSFEEDLDLSNEDLDVIAEMYLHYLFNYFPRKGVHTQQAEYLLNGEYDKLNIASFLRTPANQRRKLRAKVEEATYNPLKNRTFNESDIEKLKVGKSIADKEKNFKLKQKNVILQLEKMLNKKATVRF